MALNLSRGSLLPTYPSPEHSLCSSARFSNGYVMDQYKEKNLHGISDDSSSSWSSNLDMKNTHLKTELGGYCEPPADDIVDRLPVDPFGMEIKSTFTAITGWFQGFEKDFESYGSGVDEAKTKMVDGGFFAGLNWVWNSSVRFQPEVGDLKFDGISIPCDSFDGFGINDGGFVLDGNMDEFLSFSHVGNLDVSDGAKELQVGTRMYSKDYESYGFGVDEAKTKMVDGGLFAGLNWVWNSAVKFQPEVSDLKFDGISIPYDSFDGFGINDGAFVLDGNVEKFLSFSHVGNFDVSDGAKELQVGTTEMQDCSILYSNGDGGVPHDAMLYALAYLGVKDLLSVERVCRSLCHAVRTDPLIWRSINIDWPLNERITDDALVKLTSRAQGTLQTLSLVHCARITDGGLQHVFDSNPRLTKLSVPGCLKINVEAILLNLKTLKSAGKPGIKQLRIGGLSGITDKQFEELKFLLGADNHIHLKAPKPRFFHGGLSHLSCDDDCAIDIEACPRCQKLSLVYDCPAESCQGKHHAAQMCRACTLCIARCISCGCCLKDTDYEETFCLDLLCLDCLEKLLNCQERHGEKGAPKCAIFCQENRYQFCLFG